MWKVKVEGGWWKVAVPGFHLFNLKPGNSGCNFAEAKAALRAADGSPEPSPQELLLHLELGT
jgi:hypothetical protein